jgi:hypothetical protein
VKGTYAAVGITASAILKFRLESVVGIDINLQLHNKELFNYTRQRQEIYLSTQHPYRLWTHHAYYSMGVAGSVRGGKTAGS